MATYVAPKPVKSHEKLFNPHCAMQWGLNDFAGSCIYCSELMGWTYVQDTVEKSTNAPKYHHGGWLWNCILINMKWLPSSFAWKTYIYNFHK